MWGPAKTSQSVFKIPATDYCMNWVSVCTEYVEYLLFIPHLEESWDVKKHPGEFGAQVKFDPQLWVRTITWLDATSLGTESLCNGSKSVTPGSCSLCGTTWKCPLQILERIRWLLNQNLEPAWKCVRRKWAIPSDLSLRKRTWGWETPVITFLIRRQFILGRKKTCLLIWHPHVSRRVRELSSFLHGKCVTH